jgi:chromosomal replication initiation ATPase DnaA
MPIKKQPEHKNTVSNLLRKPDSDSFADVVEKAKEEKSVYVAKKLLFEGGCPAECLICKGQSYVRADIEDIHHPKFGRIYPCPNMPITSWRHDVDTGLIGRDRTHDFNEIENRENILEAVEAVMEILKKRRGLLLLYGGYGLGKTLLLKIAVTKVIQAKDLRFARYRKFPMILNEMRDTFNPDTKQYSFRDVLDDYTKFDLLCIDELGVESDTPFAKEHRFMLIDARYETAIEREEELMTIIATNNPLSELPGRLVDRFMDGRCKTVKLTGDSFRPSQEER